MFTTTAAIIEAKAVCRMNLCQSMDKSHAIKKGSHPRNGVFGFRYPAHGINIIERSTAMPTAKSVCFIDRFNVW